MKFKFSDKRETKERDRSELKKTTKTVDREIKTETPARDTKEARESREPTAPREKTSKELKKEEKQREKERERGESESRKRDKRREKRPSPNHDDRETRELSSVSNSSNGSVHKKSPEPQEHERGWYIFYILCSFFSKIPFDSNFN